jgi:DNA-binding NtrC family response regulator
MPHPATIEPLRHQPSPQTILCVEDNPAYLRLRKAVLEGEGYLVFSAATGSRAIALRSVCPYVLMASEDVGRYETGVEIGRYFPAMPVACLH